MNKSLAMELKAAVKAMNKTLKDNEEPLIKIVGVKRDTIMEKFFETINSYVEDKRTEEIPEVAIDFYNNVIADADGGEGDEPAETEKKTRKRSTAKAKANKPAGKKSTGKKATGKSVVERTVELYAKGVEDKAEIVSKIEKFYDGRNIASTVSSALCVLKHTKKYF